ncbi:hypothetical protein RHGRI_016391 [Rhododendron griersonianum]|uniref:Uncharacterized protein n=1 Tax=Rhododendron griersonianum TaxID=479676 RepID=A0AAV6JTY4_9ERIC|nr:hypothetical protein RHGRI_016391 [Rhododendron griersonianum]
MGIIDGLIQHRDLPRRELYAAENFCLVNAFICSTQHYSRNFFAAARLSSMFRPTLQSTAHAPPTKAIEALDQADSPNAIGLVVTLPSGC